MNDKGKIKDIYSEFKTKITELSKKKSELIKSFKKDLEQKKIEKIRKSF
ncbi:MAG: hypothetical protein WDK96_01875 [Candidatus Paceibacterota bacterium]|jgi:hypothetical protein